MKVSLNTIRSYQQRYKWSDEPAPHGADALAVRIGAQLGAIEETTSIGAFYKGIVIARVVSCQDHPDADRLHVCLLDDGGVVQGVDRDEHGYVQVVCGAPNVREGLLVAWLPPGTVVPESYASEPFELSARPLRGVVSNGMLASPRELSIGDSHEGILEIDEDIAPGTDFAAHFGLADDVIFDIENKMFTHRPDCFGLLGICREIAGIQDMAFKSPDWYRTDAPVPSAGASVLPLTVRNDVPELVPRFTAIPVAGVTIAPSPVWLQVELSKVGLRPINNIVDLTNYLMLLTGQPLHAYDYDKVKALSDGEAASIVVRHPEPGERIALLNGKTVEPRAEAIMIASDKQLIGVGGIMGGADTEVDETTRNIIIEAANFDMYSVRRTSMAHGLFTDAVTRFNKGQSPLQTRAVLAKMVADVLAMAGGEVAGALIDDVHLDESSLSRNAVHPPVNLTTLFVNQRLGFKLTAEAMSQLLTNVEFDVVMGNDDSLQVTAPFWRTDIEIAEDVVEEIGRLYGFDSLPLELPSRPARPVMRDAMIGLKQRLRDALEMSGANEVLSYSFVHGDLMTKAGQDTGRAFKLSNALSPELQFYRLSLLPSLLDKLRPNVKQGYDAFALYEIGKVHDTTAIDDGDGVPVERNVLELAYTAGDKHVAGGAAYYQTKYMLDWLMDRFDLKLEYTSLQTDVESLDDQWTQPYDPARSAVVRSADGTVIAVVGELRPQVVSRFKLSRLTSAFTLDIDALLVQTSGFGSRYKPLSKYPKTEQDLSLRLPADVSYRQVHELAAAELDRIKPLDSLVTLGALDIYQRPEDTDHRQITLRITVTSYDKTLRDQEVSAMLDAVAIEAERQLSAERL